MYNGYNSADLKTKLDAVVTQGRTFEEVEADVVGTCCGEGTLLRTAKSLKCQDGVRERFEMKRLVCNRGGASRQEEYQESLDTGNIFVHGTWVRSYNDSRNE